MIRPCGWPSAGSRERAHLPEEDLQAEVVLLRTGVGAPVREGTPRLKVVHDETEANATTASTASSSLLDEIVRDGARQMLAAALQARRSCPPGAASRRR